MKKCKPSYDELESRCREAEAALAASEERFRKILDHVEIIPVQGYDAERRVIYWNKASESTYGYTREEAFGKRLEDLIIPDAMRESVVSAVMAWLDGGPAIPSEELILRNKEGRGIPVYSSHVMHETPAGSKQMFCIDVDLRSLKKVENELRRSRDLLLRTNAMARVGGWEYFVENNQLIWTEEVYRIHETPSDFEPDIRKAYDFYAPEARPLIQNAVKEAHRAGKAFDLELPFITAKGNELWVRVLGGPLWKADKIVGVQGVFQDITERKKAQIAWEKSEERFRNVISNAPGAVYQLVRKADGSIDIPFMSKGAEELFERPMEDIVNSELLFMDVHPDDLAALWKSIEESAQTMNSWTHEFRIVLADDQARWIRGISRPRKLDDGCICWNGQLFDVSQEKDTEAALRESEERFRALVEASPMGIMLLRRGKYVFANPAALNMLGCSRAQDIIGLNAFDFIAPEYHGKLLKRMKHIKNSPEIDHLELEVIRADGSRRWSLTTSVRVEMDGEDTIIIVGQDITDKKSAEAKFRDAILLQNEAVRAANVGLWDWDLRTNAVHFSPEWKEMIGYEDHEIKDDFQEWESRVHPDDLKPTMGRIQNAISVLLKGYEVEFRFRHKNGSWRWILARSSVLSDESGKPVRVLGSHLDITERKEAEEALRKSEEEKNLILNTTGENIFYCDPDLRIVWANLSASQSTGFSPEEIQGKYCWEVMRHGSEICPDCPVIRARDSKKQRVGEIQTPDGKTWLVRGYPVTDEANNVTAMVEVMQDITKQKESERERERLEEQYRQSQKMEAIGQLTGGVAHDFNNLLQVINGGAALALMDTEPNHASRDNLNEIAKAGKRAARLVEQLLLFSRKQIMRPENLDVNEVVADLIKMLGRIIGEHIKLEWHPGPGSHTISGDRGMIEQAITNLCVNARDAMGDGGKLILETSNVLLDEEFCKKNNWATPGRFVRLSVIDSGCGMSPDTLDHIFEPFFTTKEVGKGTGLGLATVYGIVKQHEGLVYVQSQEGIGTTFHLHWPLIMTAPSSAESEQRPETSGGDEIILLVEDDASVRRLAKRFLERAGYQVLTAQNGLEAVHMFYEEWGDQIDLVILDIVMPEMGGREALKRMQTLRPNLKAIFTSGYSEDMLATNFVFDQGFDLIPKPFSHEQLLQKIRSVLDNPPNPKQTF
ncbi:MAG: PAS domain S-box protein [Candidatus Sumerlaeia bacterium]